MSRSVLRALIGLAMALALALSPSALAATYYVRTDGGPPDRCTGTADAPAPASGSGLACAWDHPFRALPPGGTPRIAAGDTLVVGTGSYQMGYGAPGADGCSRDFPWDCHVPPLPGGPSAAQPTRLLGAGWDTGCASPPELWGTERADVVLDLTGSSNVEVGCLVVTDHSSCVESHTGGLACQRETYPFGPWAAVGIYAEDAANVRLFDLDVHGLASTGILAGRLTDWTVERVRIAGNGWVGWDGDIPGTDSNSGNMTFRRLTVEWNGCCESWPGGEPTGCWGQTAGGYGDGFGTGETVGNWLFEDSAFLHNTSDGLDLLYARTGSNITIRRVRAEGNAGNQLKTNGPALIENSIAVGNCGFFRGKAFTFDVDDCRAVGNTLSLTLRPGDLVRLVNDTVSGQGDCLVLASCAFGGCNGTEKVRLRNGIFVGDEELLSPGDRACFMYQEGFPQGDALFDADYFLVTGTKNAACVGAHQLCNVAPGLASTTISSFDAHLLGSSPAIGIASKADAPAVDFDSRPRDAAPDLGAYEYVSCGTITGAVTGGGAVCPGGSSPVTVTVTGGVAPYAVTLDNGGGTRSGAGPLFTFGVAPSATTTYSVASLKDALFCAGSGSGSAAVTVNAVPATPVISAPASVAAGATNQVASVPLQPLHGGSTYAWSITNGTITGGQGTSQVTFTAGTFGTLTLTVTVTEAAGCVSAPGSANVTITGSAAGATFHPLPSPCRAVDTRSPGGYPVSGGTMGAGESRSFAVPSSSCGIPSNALAYSLNATVVPGGPLGYLTMWPTGQAQPLVSTLNSPDGRIKANAAIVPAGTGGAVSAYVTDSTDLVLDVNGYFVPAASGGGLTFYPLSPCRISDTRLAPGTNGGPAMQGGESRTISTGNVCGIPASAQALSLNYTVVPRGALGYLTTWPLGQDQPLVSTLNAPTGTVVANGAIVPTGTGGGVSIYVTNTTDVIVDVSGYFAPAGSAGALSFYAAAPCRLSDTRLPEGPFGGPGLSGGESRNYPVPASSCAIPSSAEAYSLNATVVPDGGLGYLTLWPAGIGQPLVSTLNAPDGSLTSNAAIVPAGTGGAINAFVTNSTHLILDVNGYFAP